MGWLYAHNPSVLKQIESHLRAVVSQGDREAWRKAWERLQVMWSPHLPSPSFWQPVLPWVEYPDLEALGPDSPPTLDSKGFMNLLRVAARYSAAGLVFLNERSWHVHYPELSAEMAGIDLRESVEYKLLGETIFGSSKVPEEFAFLQEWPDVCTNWVQPEVVKRLWALEEEEGLLHTAGRNLQTARFPLGVDFVTLRGMLCVAAASHCALYHWEPGT